MNYAYIYRASYPDFMKMANIGFCDFFGVLSPILERKKAVANATAFLHTFIGVAYGINPTPANRR